MNNINSYGFNIALNSEITEAVPSEFGDIFTVNSVGDKCIGLITVCEFNAIIWSFIIDFFSIADNDFLSLLVAFKNSIADGVFADLIKLCFTLILYKLRFKSAYSLIGW